MKPITGYFMAPCRGRAGDSVTAQAKWDNVQKAIAIGRSIQKSILFLELFIPHEHEEIIDELWRAGISSDDYIIPAFCKIAVRKDIGIVYDGDGVSSGMEKEVEKLREADKPLVFFATYNDTVKDQILSVMAQVWNKQEFSGCS